MVIGRTRRRNFGRRDCRAGTSGIPRLPPRVTGEAGQSLADQRGNGDSGLLGRRREPGRKGAGVLIEMRGIEPLGPLRFPATPTSRIARCSHGFVLRGGTVLLAVTPENRAHQIRECRSLAIAPNNRALANLPNPSGSGSVGLNSLSCLGNPQKIA